MKKTVWTILILSFIVFLVFYVAPAFSGDRVVDSNLFLGPVRIHLYGLSIALSVLAGWYVATRIAKRFYVPSKEVDRGLLWIVISGFVGARLYFVAFEWSYFQANPSEIIAFWNGGISIYGAIIGGIAGVWLFSKFSKVSFWQFLGLTAVVMPLGQSIGRWGNFFNQEAFGLPTSLPWGLYVDPRLRPQVYVDAQYFHPTFLYESIWNLVVFFILLQFSKKSPKAGAVVAAYLILYPLGRFFIESLRLDSVFIASVRVDQLVSLVAILLGAAILIRLRPFKYEISETQ